MNTQRLQYDKKYAEEHKIGEEIDDDEDLENDNNSNGLIFSSPPRQTTTQVVHKDDVKKPLANEVHDLEQPLMINGSLASQN